MRLSTKPANALVTKNAAHDGARLLECDKRAGQHCRVHLQLLSPVRAVTPEYNTRSIEPVGGTGKRIAISSPKIDIHGSMRKADCALLASGVCFLDRNRIPCYRSYPAMGPVDETKQTEYDDDVHQEYR